MRITVSSDVDTIHLEGAPSVPDHVWGILKEGIDGWFGTPNFRGDLPAIPQQDGCYMPAIMTQGSRVVTIRGFIKGISSVEAAVARDRICDLACRSLVLLVEDASGPKEAKCFMTGDPEPLMSYREKAFSFSLIFTCPDPLKYGPEACFEGVSGLVVVENSGRVPTWPRIRVSGGVTSLSLVSGMGRVDWVGGADVLDLDFSDMMPSSGRVTVNRPFRVGPGAERLRCSMSGAGRMDLFVRPAWR